MVKKHILPNGLSIILAPTPGTFSATILVLVQTGSKYETKEINGISHFLEHMCFKGTTKRPRAIDIAGELDGLGASYNAFTGHEYTGYYAKVDKTHINQALDVVSDIYLNQIFRPEEIKREAGVIVEELNMYKDNPKRKVGDNLTRLLYGNQPAGWDIIGSKKTITSTTREQLVRYRKEHYVASATTIVVAGSFDEKKMLAEIKKRFKTIHAGKKKGKLPVREVQTKPAVHVEYKKTDQAHALIAFRAFPIGDPREEALSLLATMLGGGMSSRLFIKVREELGAAYYVFASPDTYTDHGYLAIGAGLNLKKTNEALKLILSECKRFTEEEVSEKELQKAKDYSIGRLSLGLETTDEQAFFYGMNYLLEKKLEKPEETIAKIKKVTPVDILTVAKDIFKNEGLNMAIIGPYKESAPFVRHLSL
jgi:predicted Zn-dependent peptidase